MQGLREATKQSQSGMAISDGEISTWLYPNRNQKLQIFLWEYVKYGDANTWKLMLGCRHNIPHSITLLHYKHVKTNTIQNYTW
jgi:hypothetical protein